MTDDYYQKIVSALTAADAICVPRRKVDLYKHWWDTELHELKTKSIVWAQVLPLVDCCCLSCFLTFKRDLRNSFSNFLSSLYVYRCGVPIRWKLMIVFEAAC